MKYSLLGMLFISTNVFCMDDFLQRAYDLLEQPQRIYLTSVMAHDTSFSIANPSMRWYQKAKKDLGAEGDIKKFTPSSNAVAFIYEPGNKLAVVIGPQSYFFNCAQVKNFLKKVKFEESYEKSVDEVMWGDWDKKR